VTSNINYLSINENFPVAGEDNDTQTFRDNFDTIKTSLRAGQEEITTLQANTAKTNEDNDFEDNEISRAVFRDVMDQRFDGGVITLPTTLLTVDYENGGYQVFRFSANMNIDFDLSDPSSPLSFAATQYATWDSGLWDLGIWGTDMSVLKNWQGCTGIGYWAAPRLKFATSGIETEWVNTTCVFEAGGIL
jgi:hypothetical protein